MKTFFIVLLVVFIVIVIDTARQTMMNKDEDK